MKTRSRFLTLAMIATFAVAGCGDDNNDNESGGTASPTPVRTSTPVVAPPTATQVPVVPTVTPTGAGTQNPTPIPTGSGSACESDKLSVTITSLPGSDLDTGWTGISHNSVATHDNTVTTDLNCTGNNCTVDGTALVGKSFGSPLPLSAGGISVCVLNTFREAITGTYDCVTGCSDSSVKIRTSVFLVTESTMPCPPCVGDPTPNDGDKGGVCSGGTTPGAACDVGGISDLFQDAGGAGPDFGKTSNDCLPTGTSVGELDIDLNPLSTGTVTVEANVDCLSSFFPKGSCYCPGQVQPNACIPDGLCPASGICEQNPPNGRCSGQTFRACQPLLGTKDCEDTFPSSGTCNAYQAPCFGTTISRTGTCGTQNGVLASFFCIPETRNPSINTVSGLPGPGALLLPAAQVRTPRP